MLIPEVIERAEKRVGESIGGKWRLDRVIGVGGMAAVYEATHRNRNRVAIKLLHPALSLDDGTRHRFLREGYVANTIRHDGAVQVLDDDVTDDGVAFLVMELLRGESVEERMNRRGGALPIDEALDITEQLLDVLIAAHAQGVIHRDIKPDNLFLTEQGKLKVLDFGIARLHQGDTRETKVGSFMGTPAFCAPEQARGRWDEVDARTDLFSVGATLFTCLTGAHVHEAETSSEQLALAISATPRSLSEALPGAPHDLVQFVDQSLSYSKDDRFQSARAMKAAAARVRAGLGEHGLEPRSYSSAPPGGVTLGPHDPHMDEPDPDSLVPAALQSSRTTFRLLVGLLAAGVLAVFLLVATQRGEQKSQATLASELNVPATKTAAPATTQAGLGQAPEQTAASGPKPAPVVVAQDASAQAAADSSASANSNAVQATSKPRTGASSGSGVAAPTAAASGSGSPSAPTSASTKSNPPPPNTPSPSTAPNTNGASSGAGDDSDMYGSRY